MRHKCRVTINKGDGRISMKSKILIKNKGITLVELIIIMAVGVLVFGLILGILIETSRAVNKRMKYESVISEVESASERIASLINNIIIDESIKQAIAEKNKANFLYTSDKLGLWTTGKDAPDKYTYVEIFNNKQSEPNKAAMGCVALETNTRVDQPLGVGFEDVATEISFKYASEFREGEPAWMDSFPFDKIPALIEVKILAKSIDKEVKPLEIINTYKIF